MTDVYVMSLNRIDIVNYKGWYVKILDLKNKLLWLIWQKYIATK